MSDEQNVTPTSAVPVSGNEFDWKKFYFSFEGRATRSDYWLKMYLPFFVIGIVVGVLSRMMGYGADDVSPIEIIFAVITFWPGLAVTVKRLHDRNKKGWYMLYPFLCILGGLIPIIGVAFLIAGVIWSFWIFFIEIGCLRGTKGYNKYGADPLM